MKQERLLKNALFPEPLYLTSDISPVVIPVQRLQRTPGQNVPGRGEQPAPPSLKCLVVDVRPQSPEGQIGPPPALTVTTQTDESTSAPLTKPPSHGVTASG